MAIQIVNWQLELPCGKSRHELCLLLVKDELANKEEESEGFNEEIAQVSTCHDLRLKP